MYITLDYDDYAISEGIASNFINKLSDKITKLKDAFTVKVKRAIIGLIKKKLNFQVIKDKLFKIFIKCIYSNSTFKKQIDFSKVKLTSVKGQIDSSEACRKMQTVVSNLNKTGQKLNNHYKFSNEGIFLNEDVSLVTFAPYIAEMINQFLPSIIDLFNQFIFSFFIKQSLISGYDYTKQKAPTWLKKEIKDTVKKVLVAIGLAGLASDIEVVDSSKGLKLVYEGFDNYNDIDDYLQLLTGFIDFVI